MSRIGKLPIDIPQGVEIKVDKDNNVTVKGKLGQLEQKLHPEITIEVVDNQLHVKRPSDSREHRSMHGLYRSLLNNMVKGVRITSYNVCYTKLLRNRKLTKKLKN